MIIKRLAVAGLILATPNLAMAKDIAPADQLRENFLNPPADARPWTWYHVMSGNMTRAGLTKDLEAMADAGIGGIVLFHVTQGISIGPVKFNSPEHIALIAHAAAECERLGLKFAFHNADGWSSTGGPWIKPEQSMKKLVWKEQLVNGGKLTQFKLPEPTVQEGFYRDIAVVAYPSLSGDILDSKRTPTITTSSPEFAVGAVRDTNPKTLARLSVAQGEEGWIDFTYDKPVTIRNLAIDNIPDRNVKISLGYSDDGKNFKRIDNLDKPRLGKSEWSVARAFTPVTAKHFRVFADQSFSMGEIRLSATALINNPAGHHGLAYVFGAGLPETLDAPAGDIIAKEKLIDLTRQMKPDGSLNVRLPKGQWTIMRFGHTSTGAINVNASKEGEGLEVDKFDAAAFQTHYDAFIGPVIASARKVAPNAMNAVMIDSYEVGGQNWTQGYEVKYAARFDKSIIPYLPAFTGRVVGSGAETREFMADIRSFNEELVRENYYTTFAKLMAKEKLESLIQPYGNGPLNEVDVGAVASVPSGEFWTGRDVLNTGHSVSAGRMYGKQRIAAEAFTSEPQINWKFSPALGKFYGDRAWASGINHFLFHRFVHQANTHVMPGMTMFRWGSHIDRTQPWWDTGGKGWFQYMARGQYLLQQGHAVADIALFVGEDAPVECPEKADLAKDIPVGTEYDCVNADTLLNRARFVDGAMELPHGARYRMIWWPQKRAPSKHAIERLLQARAAGVPVVFGHLGETVKEIYDRAGLSPDIITDGPMPMYTHRKLPKSDIYFIANPKATAQEFNLSFRVEGKQVEIWDPVTGQIANGQNARNRSDGREHAVIKLAGHESKFIVFRNPVSRRDSYPIKEAQEVVSLDSDWKIAFEPEYGYSGKTDRAKLLDWKDSADPEIRSYSGKALYTKTINLTPMQATRLARLYLGRVEVSARVRINGKDAGLLWTAPYAVEIGHLLQSGDNRIEIEVANLWVNRLISDAALPDTSGYKQEDRVPERQMLDWYSANKPAPAGPRKTFTTQQFYKADDAPLPSGLIGPVKLILSGERQ
jgi:hypothetical protein